MVSPPVKAVLFDFDGTLFDIDLDNRHALAAAREALRKEMGHLAPPLTEEHFDEARRRMNVSGVDGHLKELDWQRQCFAHLLRIEGVEPDGQASVAADVYSANRGKDGAIFPDATPVLLAIAPLLPLALVTNGHTAIEHWDITGLFRVRIRAVDVGIAKPDSRIFFRALDRLGVRPGMTVFVGDTPETDIAGAKEAGMRAIWINRTGATYPDGVATPDHVLPDLWDLPGLVGVPGPKRPS